MGTPKDSEQTKRRLVQVAGVLFAEHGYTQVTVRDIIEAAQANLGALNYHFGTKECLYGEVLRAACLDDRIDESQLKGLEPRAALTLLISEALLTCTLDISDNWPYMLIKRECQFPSHMFDQLVEEHFKYQSQVLTDLIGAIVGRPPNAPEVELGLVTMVGLLDMFGLNKHLITSVLPDIRPYVDDRQALSERIAQLVIAAANQ